MELLQNVDDCRYGEDRPELRLIIEDNSERYSQLTTMQGLTCKALLALEYNEAGFEERNVRALCDIAQSTKTERHYIGAKGIGFKSVFRVTRTPAVHSGEFHFHFDSGALDGLGYLIPFPLPEPGDFSKQAFCKTRLVLPLDDAAILAEVRSHLLQDIQPTLLLFLRNLRTIEISDQSGLRKRMSMDVLQNVATLHTKITTDDEDDVKVERWTLHSYQVAAMSDTEVHHTDVVLAFCFEEPKLQTAFAWLPLRSYGFKFILQADWVVPSSRESIVESSAFNQTVRDAVPKAFVSATQTCLKRVFFYAFSCVLLISLVFLKMQKFNQI